jgi:L-asparaginase
VRIAVFTLGGTISMASAGSGGGVVARLTGSDLIAAVPGLDQVADRLDVHDVQAVPSAGLSFNDAFDLVRAASAAVDDGASGVVVTMGTDTLEELAYLVDLVWPRPEPVVFTGAMRNPTLAGPDGPANLLAAVRVATSQSARGLGAVVVFNDEIHAAQSVRKQHSTSTAAFVSPNTGPIGHVVEDQVYVLVQAVRGTPLPIPDAERLTATRVAMHTVTLDDDALLLADLHRTHQGLVVAGFGGGHVPATMVPTLQALAQRLPVVLTSRTGAGSVLRQTYASPGSEIDLQRRGLLNGGFLHPYKARALLRLLLAGDGTRDEIAGHIEARSGLG